MTLENIPVNTILKKRLALAAFEKNFAHAILLNGTEGSGNLPLAIEFAKAVLCLSSTENGACNVCTSCKSIDKFNHPDLHLSFPFTNIKENKAETADFFMERFRAAFAENPFLSVTDWISIIDEGKQGIINVKESSNIVNKLSLKAYSGGYKIMIIWRPEFLHNSAANKLLKIIEEPPQKTLFILVSEKPEDIILTILSRCQLIKVQTPTQNEVANWLEQNHSVQSENAKLIPALCDGNLGKAIQVLNNQELNDDLLEFFMSLNRLAYKRDIASLMQWSEDLAKIGREKQKLFLQYCLHLIRLSIRANFLDSALNNISVQEQTFLQKFAPFINHTNVIELSEVFNKAHYAVVRNGNAKIIFLNLSFSLIPLIHPKARA